MNDSYQHSNSRWLVLAVLAVAQFMVVLDVTIVNVALPAIQTDLGFSVDGLQWVVNAYTLAFGSLLLLGGRASDLLGRRRVFLAGLGLFATASLAGGLASSPEMLVAVRAVQGIGAALLSPAALALLTVTFPAGRDRNIALGVWGALAAIGGTLGVVAGGVLVDAAGWQWIFFVNVPFALLGLVATPRIVAESRRAGGQGFDLAGAVLASTGLLALVYAIIRTDAAGWTSAEVLGLLGAAVALLGAFVAVESRASDPLVPLGLFRTRGLSVSAIALGLNGAAFLGMFFITALYLQQVHGDSALDAGVHFLPMGVAAIGSAVVGAQLVTRIGTRAVYVAGIGDRRRRAAAARPRGRERRLRRRPAPRPRRVRARPAARRRQQPDRRGRRGSARAGRRRVGHRHQRVPDRRRRGARARLERRDLARRRRARRRGRTAGCPRGGLPARDARGGRPGRRQPADRRDPRAAHHARRGARRRGRGGVSE